MSQPQQPAQEQVGGFLGFIERAGNRIPDITMLFIAAFFITCILSAFLSQFHFGYIHPTTGKEIMVTNMLAPKSLCYPDDQDGFKLCRFSAPWHGHRCHAWHRHCPGLGGISIQALKRSFP